MGTGLYSSAIIDLESVWEKDHNETVLNNANRSLNVSSSPTLIDLESVWEKDHNETVLSNAKLVRFYTLWVLPEIVRGDIRRGFEVSRSRVYFGHPKAKWSSNCEQQIMSNVVNGKNNLLSWKHFRETLFGSLGILSLTEKLVRFYTLCVLPETVNGDIRRGSKCRDQEYILEAQRQNEVPTVNKEPLKPLFRSLGKLSLTVPAFYMLRCLEYTKRNEVIDYVNIQDIHCHNIRSTSNLYTPSTAQTSPYKKRT